MRQTSCLLFNIVISVVLASCGNTTVENGNLSKLKHERDSLKKLHSQTALRISDLEQRIMQLDTTAQKKQMLVSTLRVVLSRFEHFLEVQGTVEANKNAVINAETGGLVKQLHVQPGDQVKQGQVMVTLDTEILQNSVNEVQTSYEMANTVFQRQENLWKQKIGSEIQFLEAKNRKEALEQKLKTLQSQIEKSIVNAPFDAVVDEVFPKGGEMIMPMQPLVRLVNLNNVYAVAEVSEDYLGRIKPGGFVEVSFPSLEISFDEKVGRTGHFINPNNRSFKIYVDIADPEQRLRPNLIAVLRIRDHIQDSAIVIPANVIRQDAAGNDYVFVVDKENGTPRAKKVIVTTGLSYNNRTVVKRGLYGNEEVIIEGARSIRDGEEIML